MSKNLFLVKYLYKDYCDDTSETLEQTFLMEGIYEKLKEYIERMDILETKGSIEKISIDYIKDEHIEKIVNNILIPECIKQSEQIDKKFIDKKTEEEFLLLGRLINILEVMINKRDNYMNNPNILMMVG